MSKDDRRKAQDGAKSELRAAEEKVEAARRSVQELDGTSAPKKGITKRDVAKAGWVAPLVMTVNMPDRVFAQPSLSPVAPTPSPTEA